VEVDLLHLQVNLLAVSPLAKDTLVDHQGQIIHMLVDHLQNQVIQDLVGHLVEDHHTIVDLEDSPMEAQMVLVLMALLLTEQWVDIQALEDHLCLEVQEVPPLAPRVVHPHQGPQGPHLGLAQVPTGALPQIFRNSRTP
jgi:hypothetical protein